MIDLDVIEQKCKGAIENGYGHLSVLECGNAVKLMEVISRLRSAESEIDELLSMVRQAEKDAARYRWLMAHGGILLEPAVNRTRLYIPNYCPPSIDYVDVSKHIDEAMQCNK